MKGEFELARFGWFVSLSKVWSFEEVREWMSG
jgi:hypothetical protein